MKHLLCALHSFVRNPYLYAMAALTIGPAAFADDWPQWMGPQRDGVWRETGIVERFPTNGPSVKWRVPIKSGYTGPAVAAGRVFLTDREEGKRPDGPPECDWSKYAVPGFERVLCLDEKTGRKIWEHRYSAPYRIDYPAGPRATPLVRDGRVYTLGAMGDLLCLETAHGGLIWAHHFLPEFEVTEPPQWGYAASPLLDGNRLISLVGGKESAVVAFHKDSGMELWRSLTAQEIGCAPPVIYEIGGRRHLIVWHPDAVTGLEPETGRVLWTHKYPIEGKPKRPEVTIAMPRLEGDRLFLTSYYQGAVLFQITSDPLGAKVVWNRHGKPMVDFSAGLHTVMSTPVFQNGLIYGICGDGKLRCLEAASGDRKWETYAVTGGIRASLAAE